MRQHPGRNGDRPPGLVARAVTEALGAVATPAIVRSVVEGALRAARRAEIPERGAEVAEFIHGPLFQAAEHALGEDAATFVLEELAPLTRLVAQDEVSSVRPTGRPAPSPTPLRPVPAEADVHATPTPLRPAPSEASAHTTPTPLRPSPAEASVHDATPTPLRPGPSEASAHTTPTPLRPAPSEPKMRATPARAAERWPATRKVLDLAIEDVLDEPSRPTARPLPTSPAPRRELPLVLVASSDPSSVSRLSLALCGVAAIEPVRDALTVLDYLGRSASSVVVLDARHATVQVETLLAMDPELPEESQIIVWGERADTARRLSGWGAGVPDRWTLCGPDASVEDVAALCRLLVE